MAEAPATMVTEQQVVVNVEGPTVAGEGARTFFRQHSHVCPEMPLMAPGALERGPRGARGRRSGLREPFHPWPTATRGGAPRAALPNPCALFQPPCADDERLCRLCLLCAVQG